MVNRLVIYPANQLLSSCPQIQKYVVPKFHSLLLLYTLYKHTYSQPLIMCTYQEVQNPLKRSKEKLKSIIIHIQKGNYKTFYKVLSRMTLLSTIKHLLTWLKHLNLRSYIGLYIQWWIFIVNCTVNVLLAEDTKTHNFLSSRTGRVKNPCRFTIWQTNFSSPLYSAYHR